MRSLGRHIACVACCACVVAGCRFAFVSDEGFDSPLSGTTANDPTPAAHRPAPRTVPVEVVFARADDLDSNWQEELWNLADEQAFAGGVRRRLAANGLRAGIITGPLPPDLAARLEPTPTSADPDAAPASPVERPAVVRRILNLLPGRDNEVVAATRLGALVVLEHDGAEVHGGTYHDATTYFALKAWPAADGRVRLELVPTIKHGPLERSWVGEEGAFRLETGQKRRSLDLLAIVATIPHGGTLVVGPVGDESSTVGDAFFLERTEPRHARRILAIQPRGRPVDPMFARGPEPPPAPARDVSPSPAN